MDDPTAGPTRESHPHPPTSPRESERPIYRDDGTPDPPETESRSFLALLAESITLTIQGTAETLSRNLPWDICDRHLADARLGALQRLIEDRRLILAAYDEGRSVPRAVLVRHGWLAVTEARLNVRDAPDSWSAERAISTAEAADEGAVWLRRLGIDGPRTAASLDGHAEH
ncbi:MAG: hypothetical protein Q7T71_15775 [Herbiconiux sp.]|nr:hypothetical protein [Herbiconiux sp.]